MRQLAMRAGALGILCGVLTIATDTFAAPIVVDFEDLDLPAGSVAPADASETPFVSHGVTFNRSWNHEFDCCPGGWAYSNQTDLTTAGFSNSASAYVLPSGGGYGGSANFAVANDSDFSNAVITMSGPARVEGMYVTNTTYAYLAVVEGQDGAGFVKGPLADGDWFKLDIVGRDGAGNETGRVEFYLADYRGGQSTASSDWTWVDLTPLGQRVTTLEFDMSSTDNGEFGMNTPAYFAIDDLTIRPVPEPASWLLAFLAAVLTGTHFVRHRSRTSRHR